MSGPYGELLPKGGGDPIPLLKPTLVVGRQESSDIVLRFPNVSGHHCELRLADGHWFVKDLGSSNGTKVNGARVAEHRIDPGDTLSVATLAFEVVYDPAHLGATTNPPEQAGADAIFGRSLLESAGLMSRREAGDRPTGGVLPPRHRGDAGDDTTGVPRP